MDLIETTDETYAAVKKNFSDRAITEMLYVIGTYVLVVRVLRTGRVPLDDKPAAPHSKSCERQSRSRFEVQLKRRKLCRTK